MTTPIDLARRFADRLNTLLTSEGLPIAYYSRCQALGKKLDGGAELGTRLLDGVALPDWALFTQICSLFQVQPGYFLDETPGLSGDRAELVSGATGGDTILWNPPRGMEDAQGARKLSWLTGKTILPNFVSTDVVIFNQEDDHGPIADPCYIMNIDGSWKAKTCQVRQNHTAVFSGETEPPLILPLGKTGGITSSIRDEHKISSINRIVGTMRMSRNFV